MKFKESPYNYRLDANNQIAHFKNSLIMAIWSNLSLQVEKEQYYKINREISDVVDTLIGVVSCEYHVEGRASLVIPPAELERMVIHTLSSKLADSLIKEDVAYISVSSSLYAEKHFKVSIPFIKTDIL